MWSCFAECRYFCAFLLFMRNLCGAIPVCCLFLNGAARKGLCKKHNFVVN